MVTKVPVAKAADIPSGERATFDVDGTEITVINVDGEYHAIRNFCPHMGGPVGNGPISEADGATIVKCPFHGWRFDLVTGDVVFPGRKRVQKFDVSVEELDEVGLEKYDVDVSDETVYVSL